MEMTYDGALVMPKSFAIVAEDEMEYVDGGGWLYDLAIGVLGGLVFDIVKWTVKKVVEKGLITTAVKGVVSAYGWVKAAVISAGQWVLANPGICIAILATCTAFVAGIVIGMNI